MRAPQSCRTPWQDRSLRSIRVVFLRIVETTPIWWSRGPRTESSRRKLIGDVSVIWRTPVGRKLRKTPLPYGGNVRLFRRRKSRSTRLNGTRSASYDRKCSSALASRKTWCRIFLVACDPSRPCLTGSTGVRTPLVRSPFPVAFEINSECV
jgi:hypothetical protein